MRSTVTLQLEDALTNFFKKIRVDRNGVPDYGVYETYLKNKNFFRRPDLSELINLQRMEISDDEFRLAGIKKIDIDFDSSAGVEIDIEFKHYDSGKSFYVSYCDVLDFDLSNANKFGGIFAHELLLEGNIFEHRFLCVNGNGLFVVCKDVKFQDYSS